tara:strand:- start:172 stop:333 length:162 start_codon:yes stop_codon:yes gene_type:complete
MAWSLRLTTSTLSTEIEGGVLRQPVSISTGDIRRAANLMGALYQDRNKSFESP